MSDHKSRINTIKIILTGSREIGNAPNYTLILGELNEVISSKKISDRKKRLILQILHSTRALDSSLSAFISGKCVRLVPPIPVPKVHSLGGYLTWLSTNTESRISKLPPTSRSRFQNSIVKPRNKFMHEAGAFPNNDIDIENLLNEMNLCLTQVIAL